MKIRLATIEDLGTLNQLVNSAYRGDSSRKGWTTEADLLDGIRTSEASLEQMLSKQNAVILLAEENGLEGCVYLEHQDKALYLGMLTVRPELQGKGIGAALMKASEERAALLGCNKIRMTVITDRTELIAYYNRKGFKDSGERAPFPNDPKFGIPKKPLEFMVMEKAIQ
ncbi:MAG: GNAT family N-acetyltransferase [Chitinophagaceae bacterium]|nr:MAG: GNAT family N-acetyltransferase [Chitinophagaceae bacterium]